MNSLLEKLELGKLDVVGRLDNYQPRPNLRSEMFYSEPSRMMARPNHPLSQRKILRGMIYISTIGSYDHMAHLFAVN